ncbi:MAG: hypothetical protein ABI353_13010 [Isosphaeraceae bacterium]
MTPRASATPIERPRWAWFALTLAMVWVAFVRVPLVRYAPAHLDSDLAVDGLTLIDAVQGRWHWHFPGTPHMGVTPLVLAWPQAKVWGATPQTLVSGGVLAYEAVVLATFLLALRAFGPKAAIWGLVPLAFASTGTIWLSGRLTGGHLLTVAWHAAALTLLHSGLSRGGVVRALALGLWCGLGVYLDQMFLITMAIIFLVIIIAWPVPGLQRKRILILLVFLLGAVVGELPREVGRIVDPYDAYQAQFDPLLDREVLKGHARLLAYECLPRLIAGHVLPSLRTDPNPSQVGARGTTAWRRTWRPLDLFTTSTALALFAIAILALAWGPTSSDERAGRAVRWALLTAAAAVAAGFIVNRNIFNSDNYRYLVFLLAPWSLGFGLALERLARWRRGVALAIALGFACLMTADSALWYVGFGWVGPEARVPGRDPALTWLDDHPEVTHVFGDYWDVYRLSFLTGGRVRGAPYPIYPNRYKGWSRGLEPGRGTLLVVRPAPDWRAFLTAAWRDDGRTPADLSQLTILTWP